MVYIVASNGNFGPRIELVTTNKDKAYAVAEKMGYDYEVIETELEN